MKKIGVYLDNEPYWGGAFQYNQSILDALASLASTEYEIIVLYRYDLWLEYLKKYKFDACKISIGKWSNLSSRILRKIMFLWNVPMYNYKKLFSIVDVIGKKVDKMHLDLMIYPSQEDMALCNMTPSLSVIHDLMHRYEKFPEISGDRNYANREILYKNICESSKGIFVDSETGKKQVVDCYGIKYSSKVFVMPFTPPQYLFYTNSIPPKQKLPPKYIFYPAQFWLHKNHKNLIKAVKILQSKVQNMHLVLVGSRKNGYEEVCNLIKDLNLQNNVTILGYVSDEEMKYLYEHARAMIMASYCGPTNIPPLEGMAMGCPVAVSNVYGMPEQIGDAGLLFDPASPNSIANCIEKLWEDDLLCADLRKKGLERSKEFSQDMFNRRFKRAIEMLCKGE